MRYVYSVVYSSCMALKKSGKLTHAPLFFAITMLRFEDQIISSEQMSRIQSALKVKFPRLHKKVIKGARAQVGDQVNFEVTEITEYHVSNAVKSTGFMLRQDGFFFQTIEYETYDAFKAELENTITVIRDVLELEYYQAAGIRYVDYIKQSSLSDVREYVQPGLLGFPLDDWGLSTNQTGTETFAEKDDLSVKLRCNLFPGNYIPIPPDLQSLAENLDVVSKLSPEIPDENVIMLDTDCYQTEIKLREFDMQAILSAYDKMHQITSNVFKAAITDSAWSEWK